MKTQATNIKVIFLVLILISLALPHIQSKFQILNLTPLKGAITQTENVYFNLKDWFDGSYQKNKEEYLNESFGFRSLFIRLNNQIAFSFFRKAKANGVIIGKENYLYEENYIKAYYGTDFIGIDSITHRMEKLKFIQDTLAQLNKQLIIIFAAGKASFYPEFIPDQYKTQKSYTNFEWHLKLAKEMQLNHIDFNSYFMEQKSKTKYPLFPQYGIHWSYYGMCLAADSIIRYIENTRKTDLVNFKTSEIEMADARETDYDIAEGMNIKFRLKSFKMAYPKLVFDSDSCKAKVSALVVSDSYYWGMFGGGIITRSFSENQFWYYNQQVYIAGQNTEFQANQLSVKDEIAKHEIIIIMATDANLPGFGWGFIENAYNAYKGIETKSNVNEVDKTRLENLKNYIRTDKKWMEAIEKKAAMKQISVDSMIILDALWQIEHGN